MARLAVTILALLACHTGATRTKIQKQKHASSSLAEAKEGLCPRIQPELSDSGGAVPGLVAVTIKSAKNVGGSWWREDPYVKFWLGEKGVSESWLGRKMAGHHEEKYWKGRTPSLRSNQHPSWDWSCLMAFGSNSNFSAEIWDSNAIMKNQYLGHIRTVDLLELAREHDQRGDGEFEVNFDIEDKDGTPVE